jgi:8-oxo-dGTP pyrophosphatase MutT (NUDIX family)
VGDKLVTTKFTHSLTGGFCAIGEPNVAVCLQPGTELAFEREVECEAGFRILPPRKLGAKVARFRRVNEAQPSMHHDALELPGGKVVLVTYLREGQRATVLQLPATEHPHYAEPETTPAQRRTSVSV